MGDSASSQVVVESGLEYKEVATKGMLAYRAPSLQQPHKARQALRDAHEGKIPPLIGFYLALPTVPIARMAAQLGADFIWVDWEHSPCGVETMTNVVHSIQEVSEGRTMAFVRVPGHDHANIGFALDAGASVVVPQVDTVEQAEHVAAATKFGKAYKGSRSAPPARWLPGLSANTIDPSLSIWESVNKQAALIIQIESEVGVNNLDAMLASVGDNIDAVWIGTLDLRVSLGFDGMWGEEPEFLAVIKRYEDTLRKYDKPNSGGCFNKNWPLMANKSFIPVCGDWLGILSQRELIVNARENLPAAGKRSC
ncbi:HpcH/HpaI aldolase/citrate lyase family protein [Nannizzia gypsea CBS 118893]|uniref:HpcH/HpaI aldolase/citrate lyase family protein n=1 Tax=Arthroderma gypseum (strain ATCC MYA-4604 / CBS 118893) TaxID=535722 RepID=E4V2M1_ARTGP|nr:HpcH/HpaI aldolase/citrate lyase family protein [Nannizzia gypsea CBS 118893]EFR04286.1 HpcH/HpaI aldolase/citrate lyase family protein [Nannizzia gypsea CBS 118893]